MGVTVSLACRLGHKLLFDHVDRRYWHKVQERRSKRRLQSLEPDRLFEHRPEQAIPPDWYDLEFLYRTVRRRRPRLIFEFGSGCSSVILARALLDNAETGAEGRLTSFESDPYWADATRAGLKGPLATVAEVVTAPPIKAEYAGTPVWRYSGVPADAAPDLVLLDGPKLTAERFAAVDVLDMEERLPAGFFLIVDGRSDNCLFLEQHFRRNYRKRWNRVRKNTSYELVG